MIIKLLVTKAINYESIFDDTMSKWVTFFYIIINVDIIKIQLTNLFYLQNITQDIKYT